MGYQEILENKEFKRRLEQLGQLEQERVFCRHGLEHLLDVCRIAYIKNLEEGMGMEKDLIYGAGLLHDLGRIEEYEMGISHHVASAQIAEVILREAGYAPEFIQLICEAIRSHRNSWEQEKLTALIYFADKASRCCFCCAATEECNWSKEKKNRGIWA